MANNQKEWQQIVSGHIAAIDTARTELSRHAFGESYERANDRYEGNCLDFHHYMTETFGSVRDFADFLKSETRNLVENKGLSPEELKHLEWTVDDKSTLHEVESAARMFKENYRSTQDDVAYIAQFRHPEHTFEIQ